MKDIKVHKHKANTGSHTECGMIIAVGSYDDWLALTDDNTKVTCKNCLKVINALIHVNKQSDEWFNYDWTYVKTKLDLIKLFKGMLVSDDAEIKQDFRITIYKPTGKQIIQFREHDFS